MFKYGKQMFRVRDLAYAAAYIDGDGWICAYRGKNSYISFDVGVASNHEPTVKWFQELFGGGVNSHWDGNPNHGVTYKWDPLDKDLTRLLRLLIPYLKIKQVQAYLVMAIIDGVEQKKKPERVDRLIARLKKCNTKGPEYSTSSTTQHVGTLTKPSIRDWAYLAGLLDSEGTIAIYQKPRGYERLVSFNNRDKNVVIWAQNNFGGGFLSPRNLNPEKWAPTHKWTLSQTDYEKFLKKIAPMLKEKQEQALQCMTQSNLYREVK